MKDNRVLPTGEERQKRRMEERAFTCGGCGESFEKPLLARVSSNGLVQTFYACPRCRTEVGEEDQAETSGDEPGVEREGLGKEQLKLQGENCPHFFGYLGKRPRETAISEACLTCGRIIECMATG